MIEISKNILLELTMAWCIKPEFKTDKKLCPKTAGLFIIDDAHPERSVDGPSEITIEYGTVVKPRQRETSQNLGF